MFAGNQFYRKCERYCTLIAQKIRDSYMLIPIDSPRKVNPRHASQINAHWRSLPGEMTSYAGIVRTAAGLRDVLQLILIRRKIVKEYYWQHVVTRDLIELRNIALNASLIVRAALDRQESRGGHYREDYPMRVDSIETTVF